MRSDTVVVSLMLVNNETGTITDIAALGPVVRRHGALLHVDAVQGAATVAVTPNAVALAALGDTVRLVVEVRDQRGA